MISIETVNKQSIQWHYDLSTVFYRVLWGPHIHHGLWSGDESSETAQLKLTQTLARLAQIPAAGCDVLDVGCGMGGSSIHLAKHFGCRVTGVTLSPVQRWWATAGALWHGMRSRTKFVAADAEKLTFAAESFDLLWSVECTEHLFDKAAFFAKAATWLRPGGKVAICALLSKEDPCDAQDQQLLEDVCRGMLCPSLGSRGDYADWFAAAGLRLSHYEDWSDRVARTWKICQERVQRWRLQHVARIVDRSSVDFLEKFQTMIDAYARGSLRYGCLIAEKVAS
jgi:tocopherol O-methyltransferase